MDTKEELCGLVDEIRARANGMKGRIFKSTQVTLSKMLSVT